jgi:hypothetical protein
MVNTCAMHHLVERIQNQLCHVGMNRTESLLAALGYFPSTRNLQRHHKCHPALACLSWRERGKDGSAGQALAHDVVSVLV